MLAGSAQLLTVAAQLLANLAASSAAAARAVWAACHPSCFQALADVPNGACWRVLDATQKAPCCPHTWRGASCCAGCVRGPLCRALRLCCLASREYATQLSSGEGFSTLRTLLHRSSRQARTACYDRIQGCETCIQYACKKSPSQWPSWAQVSRL